jgi:hypothetical protein
VHNKQVRLTGVMFFFFFPEQTAARLLLQAVLGAASYGVRYVYFWLRIYAEWECLRFSDESGIS